MHDAGGDPLIEIGFTVPDTPADATKGGAKSGCAGCISDILQFLPASASRSSPICECSIDRKWARPRQRVMWALIG
jgi:hypothetical protein